MELDCLDPIQALTATSWVAAPTLLHLYLPRFLHLYNGGNNSAHLLRCVRRKGVIFCRGLRKVPAYKYWAKAGGPAAQ